MEGTYSTLAEAYKNCADGEFIIGYGSDDKYIHAQAFKETVCAMMQQQAEDDSVSLEYINAFCSGLCDFVDAFPGAPVRLMEGTEDPE
jgi:hypothetical protein